MLQLIGGLIGFAYIALIAILRGWVLVYLWDWFVVPIFVLAPMLTIPYAIGLSMIAGMVTHQYTNDDRPFGMKAGFALLGPFVTLGIAWIVKSFI